MLSFCYCVLCEGSCYGCLMVFVYASLLWVSFKLMKSSSVFLSGRLLWFLSAPRPPFARSGGPAQAMHQCMCLAHIAHVADACYWVSPAHTLPFLDDLLLWMSRTAPVLLWSSNVVLWFCSTEGIQTQRFCLWCWVGRVFMVLYFQLCQKTATGNSIIKQQTCVCTH